MKQTTAQGDTGRKSPSDGPNPNVRALPIKEFCEAYGVSAASVWRAIAAGRLRTITVSNRPHGKRLILLSSVEGEGV